MHFIYALNANIDTIYVIFTKNPDFTTTYKDTPDKYFYKCIPSFNANILQFSVSIYKNVILKSSEKIDRDQRSDEYRISEEIFHKKKMKRGFHEQEVHIGLTIRLSPLRTTLKKSSLVTKQKLNKPRKKY